MSHQQILHQQIPAEELKWTEIWITPTNHGDVVPKLPKHHAFFALIPKQIPGNSSVELIFGEEGIAVTKVQANTNISDDGEVTYFISYPSYQIMDATKTNSETHPIPPGSWVMRVDYL